MTTYKKLTLLKQTLIVSLGFSFTCTLLFVAQWMGGLSPADDFVTMHYIFICFSFLLIVYLASYIVNLVIITGHMRPLPQPGFFPLFLAGEILLVSSLSIYALNLFQAGIMITATSVLSSVLLFSSTFMLKKKLGKEANAEGQ